MKRLWVLLCALCCVTMGIFATSIQEDSSGSAMAFSRFLINPEFSEQFGALSYNVNNENEIDGLNSMPLVIDNLLYFVMQARDAYNENLITATQLNEGLKNAQSALDNIYLMYEVVSSSLESSQTKQKFNSGDEGYNIQNSYITDETLSQIKGFIQMSGNMLASQDPTLFNKNFKHVAQKGEWLNRTMISQDSSLSQKPLSKYSDKWITNYMTLKPLYLESAFSRPFMSVSGSGVALSGSSSMENLSSTSQFYLQTSIRHFNQGQYFEIVANPVFSTLVFAMVNVSAMQVVTYNAYNEYLEKKMTYNQFMTIIRQVQESEQGCFNALSMNCNLLLGVPTQRIDGNDIISGDNVIDTNLNTSNSNYIVATTVGGVPTYYMAYIQDILQNIEVEYSSKNPEEIYECMKKIVADYKNIRELVNLKYPPKGILTYPYTAENFKSQWITQDTLLNNQIQNTITLE